MSTRALLIAGATLMLVPLIVVGPVACERIEAQRERADAAEATTRQAERERAADAAFNHDRNNQAAAIAANRKEVDDATAAVPDAAPSARQRARACLELLRQAAAAGAAPPAC